MATDDAALVTQGKVALPLVDDPEDASHMEEVN